MKREKRSRGQSKQLENLRAVLNRKFSHNEAGDKLNNRLLLAEWCFATMTSDYI